MADKTTNFRLESIEDKIDKMTGVVQATHDQALKTNGRVSRLEDWREEHLEESAKWRDDIVKDLKALNNTIKVWSGGIIILSVIGATVGSMYMSSLKQEVTELVLKKIADEYQMVELAKPK